MEFRSFASLHDVTKSVPSDITEILRWTCAPGAHFTNTYKGILLHPGHLSCRISCKLGLTRIIRSLVRSKVPLKKRVKLEPADHFQKYNYIRSCQPICFESFFEMGVSLKINGSNREFRSESFGEVFYTFLNQTSRTCPLARHG